MTIFLRFLAFASSCIALPSFAMTGLELVGKRNNGNDTVKITLDLGDITKQNVDAIVNAANVDLQHGGGVCHAIFSGAGDQLDDYMETNFSQGGSVGQAYVSPSFTLSRYGIKNIVHAVGPDTRIPNQAAKKEEYLISAYTTSLKAAEKCRAQTIAFPAISTAIFGYDIEDAVQVVIPALIKEVNDSKGNFPLKEIRLVLYDQDAFNLYKNELSKHQTTTTQSRPTTNVGRATNTNNQKVLEKRKDTSKDSKSSSSSWLRSKWFWGIGVAAIGLASWWYWSK